MLRAQRRWLRGAACLGAAACAAPAPAAVESLPPIECVVALRKARIETEAGDLAAARRQIEAALVLRACELPALVDLIALHRADPDADAGDLRRRLAGRLTDPAAALPPGFLTYLVSAEAPPEQDEQLLAALEQRRERTEAASSPPAEADLVELLSATLALERRLGRKIGARQTVDRLLALEDSERWRWAALQLDLELDRWESLASLLEAMLRRPGAAAMVGPFYIVTLAHLGRYEELVRQIERLAPAPDGAQDGASQAFAGVLVEAGWALRDNGRDGEAAAVFRRALALDPGCESARLVLLHLYGSEEERAAHAAAVAERRRSEEDPAALFEEGTALLAAGDAASALDLLARAAPQLGATTLEEAAWFNLGLAASRLERWPEAAQALERAAGLNPERAETHFQRGVALSRLERCAEAVAALKRSLELKPDRYQAHHFLGLCYAALGQRDLAAREVELFRRANAGG